MGELGFTRCATEHALYTWRWGKEELVIGVYVDDLIVTGARAEDIDSFKSKMEARFRMSDLLLLSYYLGIEVRQGKEALTLGQSMYASKLLERMSHPILRIKLNAQNSCVPRDQSHT